MRPTVEELEFGNRNSFCGIILCAHEFADVEYQRRAWIDGIGPEVSSYSEALCGIFDDYSVERFVRGEDRPRGVTDEMIAALRRFVASLDAFDREIPRGVSDAVIVQRQGWQEVTSSAAAFLDVALDWLAENSADYPMMRWTWAGRTFGSS